MPRRNGEAAGDWHARALHESLEADAGVRRYLPLGIEEPDDGKPMTDEHQQAANRWRLDEEDLEAAANAMHA